MLNDWADAFFILKMVRSEGCVEGPHPEVLKFLSGLIKTHKDKKTREKLKFNKWKLRECISKIIKSGMKEEEARKLYFSLPTIKAEDISNFCKQVFLSKKETLLKLADREDKLSSFLLGQVKSNFREQVEMSEAQTVVSKNISSWVQEFLKIEENKKDEIEQPKEEKSGNIKLSRKKNMEEKKLKVEK